MLGRAIGRDIGVTLQARGGRDGDDAAAAALDHDRQYRLRGMDHAHEIDVHHPLEQRRIGAAERRRFRRTGIGNEDVDRLPGGGFRNGRFDRRLIGDVGNCCELRRAGCHGFIQRYAVATEHRYRRTRFRQRRRYRKANAPPAAGDDRMGGTRQSGHRPSLQDEGSEYILDFKLLQGSESRSGGQVARMSGAISGTVSGPGCRSAHPGYGFHRHHSYRVIASAAKQSIARQAERWIASSLRSSQ